MAVEDTRFWETLNGTIFSVVSGVQQYWFRKGHNHDEGASSQRISFFSVSLNRAIFGYDSYEL